MPTPEYRQFERTSTLESSVYVEGETGERAPRVGEGERSVLVEIVILAILATVLIAPLLWLVSWLAPDTWSSWKHAMAGWGVSAWDWSWGAGQWTWWIVGAILLIAGRRFVWPVTQVVLAIVGVTLTVFLFLFALVGIGSSGGREGRH
jgi:thiamine transporter ThiT